MNKIFKLLTQIAILNFLILFGIVYVKNLKFKNANSSLIKNQADKSLSKRTTSTIKPLTFQNNFGTLQETMPNPKSDAIPTIQESKITEVEKHSQKNDCWVTYEDHIYDITSFFGSHPGGDDVITPYCGKDITSAFNTKTKILLKIILTRQKQS